MDIVQRVGFVDKAAIISNRKRFATRVLNRAEVVKRAPVEPLFTPVPNDQSPPPNHVRNPRSQRLQGIYRAAGPFSARKRYRPFVGPKGSPFDLQQRLPRQIKRSQGVTVSHHIQPATADPKSPTASYRTLAREQEVIRASVLYDASIIYHISNPCDYSATIHPDLRCSHRFKNGI